MKVYNKELSARGRLGVFLGHVLHFMGLYYQQITGINLFLAMEPKKLESASLYQIMYINI